MRGGTTLDEVLTSPTPREASRASAEPTSEDVDDDEEEDDTEGPPYVIVVDPMDVNGRYFSSGEDGGLAGSLFTLANPWRRAGVRAAELC